MKKRITPKTHVKCADNSRVDRYRRAQVSEESQRLMDDIEDFLEFMNENFPEDTANIAVLAQMYDDLALVAREYSNRN